MLRSFLLIKYFAVSTCELFSQVQLVTVSFAFVSKNVAVYYVMQRTAVHELDTPALVVYKP